MGSEMCIRDRGRVKGKILNSLACFRIFIHCKLSSEHKSLIGLFISDQFQLVDISFHWDFNTDCFAFMLAQVSMLVLLMVHVYMSKFAVKDSKYLDNKDVYFYQTIFFFYNFYFFFSN